MRLRGALLAEFIGTFFLIFAGTGAIAVDAITHEVTHVGVSLVFGLVISVLIYALGHISGAHFNPAVTIGFCALGEFPGRRVPPYIAAQIIGAIAASGVVFALFGRAGSLGVTTPHGAPVVSLLLETLMTFLLVLVIFGSAVHGKAVKSFAGLAIGGTIALDALFGGPISGASMNPARSLGPALVSGMWSEQWIYIAGPLLGALLAVGAYRLMTGERPTIKVGTTEGD
jgi:aquaporin NIP